MNHNLLHQWLFAGNSDCLPVFTLINNIAVNIFVHDHIMLLPLPHLDNF